MYSICVAQNLSPHTHQDALELHIEAVTECDVINVEYRYGRTEAIVRLDRSIKGGKVRRESFFKIFGSRFMYK